MLDVRSLGMGLLASSTLALAAPVWPGSCNGGIGGTGGVGGAVCGNGRIDGDEYCDGADLRSWTCRDAGAEFVGGTLKCDAACQFDTSECKLPVCGDGKVEALEVCDGTNFAGVSTSCTSHSPQTYAGGTIRCDPQSCTYDFSSCSLPACGNGVIEPGEYCDGADISFYPTCAAYDPERYAPGGTIKCLSDCSIDTSGCKLPVCGDGKVEADEDCEGANLGRFRSCTDVHAGYLRGELRCGADCKYDTSSCETAVCGDGKVEYPEPCDGTNFAGKTCAGQSYALSILGVPTNYKSGNLKCDRCSRLDTSECVPWPGCYISSARFATYPYCI
ncbi:MAG TPA: hypothetical protein VK524_13905 [Polyangiaceae bacterium]|nr:hypothetical protein [Polyangiaceae bacterium]